MKIYKLEPKNPWVNHWYDNVNRILVQAKSPISARKIAELHRGDEPEGAWLDAKVTGCRELKVKGTKEFVVMIENY